MSQFASLTGTFRRLPESLGMTEKDATDLFIQVMGDIEWSIIDDDTDYSEDWEEREFEEARKILFGDKK